MLAKYAVFVGGNRVGYYSMGEGILLWQALSYHSADYGISPLARGFDFWVMIRSENLDSVLHDLVSFGYASEAWKEAAFNEDDFWEQLTSEERERYFNKVAEEEKRRGLIVTLSKKFIVKSYLSEKLGKYSIDDTCQWLISEFVRFTGRVPESCFDDDKEE